MRALLPLTLLLAACNFDSSTATAPDPFAPDAMDPSAPDADPNAPDSSARLQCTDWDLTPNILDPCQNNIPIEQDNLVLTLEGLYRYNTDDGKLTDKFGTNIPTVSTTLGSEPGAARIMVTANLHLGADSILRVVGPRPLIILSWGGMLIEGEIDVSSGSDGLGAGADSEFCMVAEPGTDAAEGSGGGGGGGLGQDGGKGGTGRVDGEDNLGGNGGTTLSLSTVFHGGCAGGDGGDGNAIPDRALGGHGGGALYLLARTMLNFRGTVNAGGQGGQASKAPRGGGGGGGSGGMLVLESNVLTVQLGSVLTANGGGGGGGSDMKPQDAEAGAPGTKTIESSTGGTGEKANKGAGGLGGSVSALLPLDLAGQESDRGGGGGGGGFGHIRLRSNHLTHNSVVVSPKESTTTIGTPQ